MLLTITYTGKQTQNLGYLLHKNPYRAQSFDLSYGHAYVFYPEVSDEKNTAALLLDINPIDLARGKLGTRDGGLFDYVNDRPYVSSSFMSTALSRVFNTAMSGKCDKNQELADTPINLTACINMLPCRGTEELPKEIFEPLGYTVETRTSILDEKFPEWGDSAYIDLTISGTVTLSGLLNHLYVLIPVFDKQKHYYVSEDEIEKLMKHGEGWLAGHPARNKIVNRDDADIENEILYRLDKVLTKTGFWSDFATDWVCLDTELMPWSEKAQTLLSRQYAPVGRAGRESIAAAISVLEETCKRPNRPFEVDALTSGQNADPLELLERFKEKQQSIDGYIDAYREYCWKVSSVDDLKIAPFHLLACEGNVFSREKHVWHMEKIKQYCTGIDPVFMATEYICVDTADESSVNAGVDWWTKLTSSGGEGMVVKPETFVARRQTEVLQPAVKCRGPEYLRIIYGPEYLMPEHLTRLKKRSLSRKRSLAIREFSLGMESLTRFVNKEPLYRVHECVFGVLAFESEPVDPRL